MRFLTDKGSYDAQRYDFKLLAGRGASVSWCIYNITIFTTQVCLFWRLYDPQLQNQL